MCSFSVGLLSLSLITVIYPYCCMYSTLCSLGFLNSGLYMHYATVCLSIRPLMNIWFGPGF